MALAVALASATTYSVSREHIYMMYIDGIHIAGGSRWYNCFRIGYMFLMSHQSESISESLIQAACSAKWGRTAASTVAQPRPLGQLLTSDC